MAVRTGRRVGVILFRGGLIFVIVGATAAISLIRGDLWDTGKPWELWFIYAIAGAGLIDQFIKIFRDYRQLPDHKLLEPFNDLLVQLLADVSRLTSANWEHVGVHAFRVKGWWRTKRLRRVKRLRVRSRPGGADIRWTKGKGPLGLSWETKEPELLNLREKLDSLTKTPDEQAFNGLGDKEKMNLSYKEYCKLIKHFAEVGAWPILDANEEPIGCIVVDIPHRGDAENNPDKRSLLEDEDVSERVAGAAELASRIMKPRH
ncbi:hypothetical protein [Streptomyces spororaveus]|uniref:hypothetical protein n=1 Tax=Streptomyces spororaveus TaxID=284039 RepID=UPI0037B9C6D9